MALTAVDNRAWNGTRPNFPTLRPSPKDRYTYRDIYSAAARSATSTGSNCPPSDFFGHAAQPPVNLLVNRLFTTATSPSGVNVL
jgi:hypothetical protein